MITFTALFDIMIKGVKQRFHLLHVNYHQHNPEGEQYNTLSKPSYKRGKEY